MNLRILSVMAMTLSIGACASVPPPPHCEDDGTGMQPINPEMLTQEQINAYRAEQEPSYQAQHGRAEHGERNQ